MSKSIQAIKDAFNLCLKRPILFLPALAPIIIQVLFQVLGIVVFPATVTVGGFSYPGIEIPGVTVATPNTALILLGNFLAALVGFIAICMIVDMANDVSNGGTANLNKSLSFVMGKLGTLIIAAIIAAVCIFTFVLIPVALFIAAIAIIERTDAIESTKRSFRFVARNLGEVIVFIILVIIISAVLGVGFAFIPVVGSYLGSVLNWVLTVVWAVAALIFYLSLRDSTQSTLPPPPPPPPPTY
jgi:uncharacterized membrane protein